MEIEGNQITPIGRVNFRNDDRVFGIKDKDRLNHIYCLGKSGTGKSTLLLNMAISDINRGRGIAVIDPHGDVAEELLNHIPHDRIKDVVYFNPAEHQIGFNPLRNVHPDFHHLVASGLLSTFAKLFAEFWGPRMAHILRYSLLTLLEYRNATLLDITPLVTDSGYREMVLQGVSNHDTRRFWEHEFNQYSKSFRLEAIAPILNKVGLLHSSLPLKKVFGQQTVGFRMDKVMDEGKVLIANLSKGKLGEDASNLLGSILLSTIQLGAMSRAKQPEHERKPFFAYTDEVHNYMTLSIADMLSECRKYGLGLFLTHQYIGQLNEEIRKAVFGNVGTLISFRVGTDDAQYLSNEFHPVFNEIDLINLPRYSMYLKLQIDDATSRPFSAYSLPLKEKGQSFKEEVIAYSRKQYGKLKVDIDQVNGMRYRVGSKRGQEPPTLFTL